MSFPFFLCCFPGDLPYEAHVQTHTGGAFGDPSLSSAQDRVPRHPYTDCPHLSSSTLLNPPPRDISSPLDSVFTYMGSKNVPD